MQMKIHICIFLDAALTLVCDIYGKIMKVFFFKVEVKKYLKSLISHASKVMLKILQARLQQYMSHELPDV